jgi:PTH2 family peptidyl-tRNA hydrolase
MLDMELKQVIVVRADLGMGKGKIAAQAAHAAISAADKSPLKRDWVVEGQKKTVVKVSGEKELLLILQQAREMDIPCALIEDAGHTQLPPGTKTAVGLGPEDDERLDKITGELKLL